MKVFLLQSEQYLLKFRMKKIDYGENREKLPEQILPYKHKQNKKMKNLKTNIIGIFSISC